MVRRLACAFGACWLISLPACSDRTSPTPGTPWLLQREVALPAGSLTYVRPVPQDVVSGLVLRIGLYEGFSIVGLPGLALECPLRWDGARFVCDLPVNVRAATEYWIYVRDPARPHGGLPGICATSYTVVDTISVLNHSVLRPIHWYQGHLCDAPALVFQVSPTGEVR